MEKLKSFVDKSKKYIEETAQYRHQINDVLSCELLKAGELGIHIGEELGGLSPEDKQEEILHGFHLLAVLLNTEPKLAHVKKISGMSWIVARFPRVVKMFGFDIAENLDGLETQKEEYKERIKDSGLEKHQKAGYAYMSKEKFLNLYTNLKI